MRIYDFFVILAILAPAWFTDLLYRLYLYLHLVEMSLSWSSSAEDLLDEIKRVVEERIARKESIAREVGDPPPEAVPLESFADLYWSNRGWVLFNTFIREYCC